MKEDDKLKALESLTNNSEELSTENEQQKLGDYKLPEVVDGYRIMPNIQLPFEGKLYPESWRFAFRCPTTLEVANFSTINEKDQPSIINAINELVRKCWVIVDSETNNQISSDQINDGERLFFFLKLREFYLNDAPITYITMNQMHQEPVTIKFLANMLVYPELKEKLLSNFDGRRFSIPVPGLENNIEFLIPTINISQKIFRYIIKTYKEIEKSDEDTKPKVSSFDKQFILILPFLYETGSETIESLKIKFKSIQKNDKLMDAYLTIVNKIKLTHLEKIEYTYKESEEEALIKFPGGWKNIFINSESMSDLFD